LVGTALRTFAYPACFDLARRRDAPKLSSEGVQSAGRTRIIPMFAVRSDTARAHLFFTIFVDEIFTTLVEGRFTNVLAVIAAYNFASCLCSPCNVD
jgi:hypothetical protein